MIGLSGDTLRLKPGETALRSDLHALCLVNALEDRGSFSSVRLSMS